MIYLPFELGQSRYEFCVARCPKLISVVKGLAKTSPDGRLGFRHNVAISVAWRQDAETAAWKAVSTLRLDINHHTSRPEGLPETFEQLAEHYQLIELDLEKASERKGHQTKQT